MEIAPARGTDRWIPNPTEAARVTFCTREFTDDMSSRITSHEQTSFTSVLRTVWYRKSSSTTLKSHQGTDDGLIREQTTNTAATWMDIVIKGGLLLKDEKSKSVATSKNDAFRKYLSHDVVALSECLCCGRFAPVVT